MTVVQAMFCWAGDQCATAVCWFSMSLLPRLHHHDIMTIVELFSRTKSFCHILTQDKKKKKGKFPFPGPSPNPNCNTTPWPFDYKALLTTAVHCAIFNAPTLHDVTIHDVTNGMYIKNISTIAIMSW